MAVRGENSLHFSTGIDNSGLESGIDEAIGMISNMGGAIAAINPFAVLAGAAVAAFSTITTSAMNMMREFEHAMKEVETISKATQDNFEGIANSVFALSNISPDAPKQLAEAYYQIVSAGYDGADGLKLLETASKAATAGVTDTKTAADGITTALNAFKLEAEEAETVADKFFTTVKLGKTNFEQLSANLEQAAPIAAAFGYSLDEVLAAVATLTKQGVPTNKAFTQIRTAIEKAGEVMGDGAAEAMSLQNVLQAVYDKAGGSQNKLSELVGSVEAMSAVLALAGDNAEGAAEDLTAIVNASGASEEAFKRMATSNKNELSILRNRIQALTKGLGNEFVELSSSIAKVMNNALDSTNEVTEAYYQQKTELYELERALKAAEEGSEEWNSIRDEIAKKYPDFIEDIDLERATTQNLLDVLRQVNDAYRERYKISKRDAELKKAQEELGVFEIKYEDNFDQFQQIVDRLRAEAEDNGVELQIDWDKTPEEIYKSIREQFEQQDDSALDWLLREGYANDEMRQLKTLTKELGVQNTLIQNQNKEVEELIAKNRRLAEAQLETTEGQKAAIEAIKQANSEVELAQYAGTDHEAINEALRDRRAILEDIEAIKAAETIEDLKPYLDSQIQEVQKFAQKRKRLLNTDYEADITPDPEAAKKKFQELLDNMSQQYEAYQAYVNQIGKDAADEQFSILLSHGEDYASYLQNLLDTTSDAARRQMIALEAEKNNLQLNTDRPTVETLFSEEELENMQKPIVLDVEVNDESIHYIRKQLEELRAQFEMATAEEREELRPVIEYWQQRLEQAETGTNREQSIYADLYRNLSDLNREQLRDYIDYWKQRAKEAKEGSEAEQKALDRVKSAQKEQGERMADSIRSLSGGLGQASDMFRKFGEEDLANALEKLEEVGNHVANIATGIASGNWLQVVGGVIGGITSLIGGGNNKPEKSQYEKTIESLEDSIKRLGYQIDRAFGSEAIALQNEQLTEYDKKVAKINEKVETYQQIMNELATEESVFARHAEEHYQGLLDEAQMELDALEAEYADAINAYRENLTGVTSDSIADSIIQGFRDGKRGIDEFADTFEGVMQDTMMTIFKNNFLAKRMQEFYEELSAASEQDEDGQQRLSPAEIEDLRDSWQDMLKDAENEYEALQEIMQSVGMGGMGGQQKNKPGMSGAIQSITEDTANVLEGYLNAVRLDVRAGLNAALSSLEYQRQIASNTYVSSEFLRSIDGRFATIEDAIHEFQAQG